MPFEILNAGNEAAIVREDPSDDGVRADLEVAGLESERNEVVGGIEKRSGVAAFPASAAVVTRGKSPMGASEIRAPAGDDGDAEFLASLLEEDFPAARGGGGHEIAASRKDLGVVGPAADPDELLDPIIIRSDIGVADGPRNPPAVTIGGREIEVRHTKAHTAPDVRFPSASPDTREVERAPFGSEVRLLFLVEEELRRSVAAPQASVRLEGKDVRPELRPIERIPGVEEKHLDAFLREVVRGHAPRSAAPDDDDVGHGYCPAFQE